MEEKTDEIEDRAGTFAQIAILFFAVIGLAVAVYYGISVKRDYDVLSEQYLRLSDDYSALNSEYSRVSQEYIAVQAELENCREDVDTLETKLIAEQSKVNKYEHLLDITTEFYILYDAAMADIVWYNGVTDCETFLEGYETARSDLEALRDFIREHKEELEEIFSRDIAAEYHIYGFIDYGGDTILSAVNKTLGYMSSDYEYCTR